jgi:hypothetical protein
VNAGPAKLTRVYLDDHQALLLAGCEFVRRMLRRASEDEEAAFLRMLLTELEDDRDAAIALLVHLGGSPSRLKSGLAWLAEKAGRLKPNGSVLRPTPLTNLVELDGVRLLLESNRSLWRGLEAAGATVDARRRAERADRALAEAERLRLLAADRALRGEAVADA